MSKSQTKASDLTLFSALDSDKYEKFVLPFIFFPLASNEDVRVEVHLKNYDSFIESNAGGLQILEQQFGNRFAIHPLKGKYFNILPCGSTSRFFTEPIFRSKWTKISDIDLMHVENHLVNDFDELEKEKPSDTYFALKRGQHKKISGTLCVKTSEFYSSEWRQNLESYFQNVVEEDKLRKKTHPFDQPLYYHDEFVNYDLIIPVHGLPSSIEGKNVRPIQGIHISPNRPPYPEFEGCATWGITEERKKAIQGLMSSQAFSELLPHLAQEMNELLEKI
jgi:hypothetical protein